MSAATPTISFSVANQVYGTPPFTVTATSNSSGAFTYSVVSGPATITGNTVTLTGTGNVTLQASQAATTFYAAGAATATFVVSAATPTISFSVANQTFGNAPFTVTATSNSPGAFTYSVVSGPATITGNTVTLTGTGNVTLQASQAATTLYAAGSATATFLVSAATPTISFSVANQTFGNAPFTVTATSNSPGAFTYSVVSGPAAIAGNTVTLTGAGSVTLMATQAATSQYASGSATATFLVAAANPGLSFVVANQTLGTPPFTVTATSASPGAITYSLVSGPATVTGNTVTLNGAGSVTLQATQAATANFVAASASATFLVTSGLTLTATPSTASVVPAGSVDFALQVAPGSGATFPNPIQLSATGLPNGATAIFSPSQIAAGAGTTQAKMTIQTTIEVADRQPQNSSPVAPIAFGLLLLPGLFFKRSRQTLRKMPLLFGIAAFSLAAMLGASGCGAGIQPRNEQFKVVVSATDTVSGATSSATVTLLVK